MKKMFFISLFFIFAAEANAKCNLKDIDIGASFSSLQKKYKLDDSAESAGEFTSNSKGKHICKELNEAEVSTVFSDKKLAQLQIKYTSESTLILDLAVSSFGNPKELPNKQDPNLSSFSAFWDNGKSVVTYSFSHGSGKFSETISIQGKAFAEEISEAAQTNEDKK